MQTGVTFLLAGPAAVLTAAGRARVIAAALLAVPGRVLDLLDRAEIAVARIEALVETVAVTVARADAVALRAGTVVGEAERVSQLSGVVATDALGVVAGASEAQEAVATLVRAYEPTLATLQPTLATLQPTLATLQPTLTRLAESMDPREVDALVGLVDRLPPLLESVDGDVLPLLGRLNEMAPDLHALLESVNDLRRTVAGLPGIGLLRRRGDDELTDSDPEPFTPDPTRQGATRAPNP